MKVYSCSFFSLYLSFLCLRSMTSIENEGEGPSSSSSSLLPIRSSNRLAAKGPMISLAASLLESRRISTRKTPIARRRYISAPCEEEKVHRVNGKRNIKNSITSSPPVTNYHPSKRIIINSRKVSLSLSLTHSHSYASFQSLIFF